MSRKFMVIGLALVALIAAIGCQQDTGLTEADVQSRAEAMAAQMVADQMANQPAGMTDADVEARAMEMANQMMMEQEGGRLASVRERGQLICASNNSLPGFGSVDAAGNTVGFDIDLCRAVAAAVLGDPNAVEFRPTTAAERGPHDAVGRSGYNVPQHHLDFFPQYRLGQLRAHDVLRRARLYGSQSPGRIRHGRAARRERLRAARHHH